MEIKLIDILRSVPEGVQITCLPIGFSVDVFYHTTKMHRAAGKTLLEALTEAARSVIETGCPVSVAEKLETLFEKAEK
jgi:hypothetical protein